MGTGFSSKITRQQTVIERGAILPNRITLHVQGCGESFDTSGPVGPWLTTADEVLHPDRLGIRTWVDGELRQNGNTSELIYSFGEMIEELSSVFTLEPGDILATGTPSGVGQSFDPPRFLKAGQVVRVEIEGLGHIENTVIAEPGYTPG